MKTSVTNFIIFTVGAIIGSAVTWKLTKTKYERIAQEEIDSVKEVFKNKMKADNEKNEYSKIIDDLSYVSKNEKKGEPVAMEGPYIITPEEFDENGYETVSLTYYADKVLVDDMGDIVEDVDEVVGYDSLNHFGEYEEDSVFVRDDRLKIDYEILLDTKNYYDSSDDSPHRVE